jgi:hypothetical protein
MQQVMMKFSNLNENNFMMYAMKLYENPQCLGMEEFQEDLNRIKYVKRLLRRYHKTGILKERLILNHIIVIANVFGIEGSINMLFYKLEKDLHSLLKTFLVFLQYIPADETKYDLIPLDNIIIDNLRKL